MPTILIEGHQIRFYSSDRLEPPHVHVLRIVSANSGRLVEAWHAYFRES